MPVIDIAIIGSGAASSITLAALLKKILDDPAARPKLTITVIEKYPEFWKGIPYGSRSSVNSLIITAVTDFIQDKEEQNQFFNWILLNLEEIVSNYSLRGGLAAKNWLEENLPRIKNGEWDKVYTPRFLFGIYLENKLTGLIRQAEEKNLIQLNLIQAEAIDIEKDDSGLYKVVLEGPDKSESTIAAKKLVIATGSVPVKKLVTAPNNTSFTYINDVYEPSLSENIHTLKTALLNPLLQGEYNVLIIGSNASSIELLYLLNNLPEIKDIINKIVVVSPKGSMPYHIDHFVHKHYPCPQLDLLKESGVYTIDSLVASAKKDMALTIENGSINVPYTNRVIGYTMELLQALDEEAKKAFYGIYGMQITKIIRRSGPAYKDATEALLQSQKLETLKGAFLSVTPVESGALLNYVSLPTQELQTLSIPFKVVINCTGSDDLEVSASRLLNNLAHKKLVTVNLSGKGLLVNENFEAAPNLYVIGPMLGGNMNKKIYTWHLENVAKLFYYAPAVAGCLLGYNK